MSRAGPALLAAIVCVLAIAACGGDDEDAANSSPTQPSAIEATTGEEARPDDAAAEPDEQKSTEDPGPELSPDERAAIRTVRDYVDALDARDGERVCALLVPGAIDAVELPKQGADCAEGLEASIGYRDPRGLPVWKTARVVAAPSVDVEGDEAKVVATTVTEFADRDEPSIEDDVVYLVRPGGDWLIAKPSSTLYRSVGVADVPPSVLAPPS